MKRLVQRHTERSLQRVIENRVARAVAATLGFYACCVERDGASSSVFSRRQPLLDPPSHEQDPLKGG